MKKNVEHEIVEKPLSFFKKAAYNPRKALNPGDPEYTSLKRSITRFGHVQILVVNKDGTLIGGHQTLSVLTDLGYQKARCVVMDLPKREEKALNIALNKVQGEWDFVKLRDLLAGFKEEGVDEDFLSAIGFDEKEFDSIVAFEPGMVDGKDPDEIPKLPTKATTKPGDIWQLGDHRLFCGDAGIAKNAAKLLGERKIQVAVTSPPYAAQRDYDEGSGFKPVPPEKYGDWFYPIQSVIAFHLSKDGSFFLNIKEHCEDGSRVLYVKDLTLSHVRKWGWKLVDEFAWVHGGTPKAVRLRFKNGWEPIFQFSRGGGHKFRPKSVRHESEDIPSWDGKHPSNEKLQGGEGMAGTQGFVGALDGSSIEKGFAYPSNVLSLGRNREALGHSAAYPVALPEFFIKAYSDKDDVIFDPFLGSGSTMIAGERQGRPCYGFEISPIYCDVIVKRWEMFTGKKAKRV